MPASSLHLVESLFTGAAVDLAPAVQALCSARGVLCTSCIFTLQ